MGNKNRRTAHKSIIATLFTMCIIIVVPTDKGFWFREGFNKDNDLQHYNPFGFNDNDDISTDGEVVAAELLRDVRELHP